jgi:hypothetical protein
MSRQATANEVIRFFTREGQTLEEIGKKVM